VLQDAVVARLHRKAKADRWGVTRERFALALEAAPVDDHASLHLEDLALATACADGHEGAWDHFVREHRPILYRAADAIDKTGAAREAADALYAELFGLTEREGERRSLFRYFHGRSSLATWLRAVLAQRYVDVVRRGRRLEPLPENDEPAGRAETVGNPERPRLAARDRLRLACYYAQGLTLAQIGRTLREHEATTSRHLARTRRLIREDVEKQLKQSGMNEAEVNECFASVVDDAGTLDLAEMLTAERKNDGRDRSK
jgi:RNA polymerase sigma-70 factor (ECF subfamily)